MRPVGLQVNAATLDEIAVAEDERTEIEILNEMPLEILRRRPNGQLAQTTGAAEEPWIAELGEGFPVLGDASTSNGQQLTRRRVTCATQASPLFHVGCTPFMA